MEIKRKEQISDQLRSLALDPEKFGEKIMERTDIHASLSEFFSLLSKAHDVKWDLRKALEQESPLRFLNMWVEKIEPLYNKIEKDISASGLSSSAKKELLKKRDDIVNTDNASQKSDQVLKNLKTFEKDFHFFLAVRSFASGPHQAWLQKKLEEVFSSGKASPIECQKLLFAWQEIASEVGFLALSVEHDPPLLQELSAIPAQENAFLNTKKVQRELVEFAKKTKQEEKLSQKKEKYILRLCNDAYRQDWAPAFALLTRAEEEIPLLSEIDANKAKEMNSFIAKRQQETLQAMLRRVQEKEKVIKTEMGWQESVPEWQEMVEEIQTSVSLLSGTISNKLLSVLPKLQEYSTLAETKAQKKEEEEDIFLTAAKEDNEVRGFLAYATAALVSQKGKKEEEMTEEKVFEETLLEENEEMPPHFQKNFVQEKHEKDGKKIILSSEDKKEETTVISFDYTEDFKHEQDSDIRNLGRQVEEKKDIVYERNGVVSTGEGTVQKELQKAFRNRIAHKIHAANEDEYDPSEIHKKFQERMKRISKTDAKSASEDIQRLAA